MKIPVRIEMSAAWRLAVIADALEEGGWPSLGETNKQDSIQFLRDLAGTIMASVSEPDPDDIPPPEPPEES